MNVKAVVFDWAGTMVDHGSRAPVATLQNVFAGAGVPISVAEARRSMGIAKKAHIREILLFDRVAEQWEQVHGRRPGEAEVERLYADFEPRQLACLAEFSGVVGGVPETLEALRGRGVKIGSTTGYTRAMLDLLVKRASGEGCSPDAALCPDDVPGGGRPAPWMCYRTAIELEVFPLAHMVKVGDTPSDIAEGINAGMWTIGITRTGNEIGLTASEWAGIESEKQVELLATAAARLLGAGAHYVAESVGECLAVMDEVAARIAAGERP